MWARKRIMRRADSGASSTIMSELDEEDPRGFDSMNSLKWQHLLIRRSDTIMREALSAKVKLEITLASVVSGTNFRALSHLFRVSKAAISTLIPGVCEAIRQSLEDYICWADSWLKGTGKLECDGWDRDTGEFAGDSWAKDNAVKGASRSLNMAEGMMVVILGLVEV
ncbi:hypothetical protein PR048_000532 [Dryococelus australis]|uniref:Uncharacterized protein n=1 Tax=Dryococelus australis TaxID=614101 RepID=A0ABQ9IFH6_9NEOP|nr:hypothetical protein PR048_000532 [Dryococelus australis]